MESNQQNIRESERPQLTAEQPTHFLSQEDSIDLSPEDEEQRPDGNRPLGKTIQADIISNRKFLGRQTRITLSLFLFILLLEILPSPLIISSVQNDPSQLSHEPCPEEAEECSSVGQGYETIAIRHLNPLQRQLKYFLRLNKPKLDELSEFYPSSKLDINEQITWVEIYASRNGKIYGDVIYQKDGKDIYEVLFDDDALIFLGEVHILQEQNYIIKIYKVVKTIEVPGNRQLQTISGNTTIPTDIETNSTDNEEDKGESQAPKQEKEETNKTQPLAPPIQQQNSTITPVKNQTMEISIPITVEMIRYSAFYTVSELVLRYVTFLFVIYIRSQTRQSPAIFHFILILVCNPLIFIELAFPNTATNCLSNIFGSTYLIYLAVFLYYWHRRLKNPRANVLVVVLKVVVFLGLWVSSIIRQLHLVNTTKVQLVQSLLMCLVLLPLVHYLWKLYVFKLKTILHRNTLLISLTIYYLLFLFFSGYVVSYGWKKISFFVIVQTYGIELCHLTAPVKEQGKKKHQLHEEHQLPESEAQNAPEILPKPQEMQANTPEIVSRPSSKPFVEVD